MEIFQATRNPSEIFRTICEYAQIVQVVPSQIFQPVHECMHGVLKTLYCRGVKVLSRPWPSPERASLQNIVWIMITLMAWSSSVDLLPLKIFVLVWYHFQVKKSGLVFHFKN